MAGIADDLKRIPMSAELASTLARAAEYSGAQQHSEVSLEHLLLALAEDADAIQVLTASHVELSLLKADVSQYLGRLTETAAPAAREPLKIATDLKRILEAAAAAASQGRRRDINGAIVLAAIVGDGRSSAAHMLRAQGLTFEEAIKALQQAMAAPAAPERPAPGRAPAALPPSVDDAEDLIASARARVNTRMQVQPAEVPAAARPTPSPPDPNTGASPSHPEPWPPEVRPADHVEPTASTAGHDSGPSGHAEIQQAPPMAPDGSAPHEVEFAGGYDDGMEVVSPVAPPSFQTALPDPPAMPTEAHAAGSSPNARSRRPRPTPEPGTRWPAPVAPAWQEAAPHPHAAVGSGTIPPPLPHSPHWNGQNPPHADASGMDPEGSWDTHGPAGEDPSEPSGHWDEPAGDDGAAHHAGHREPHGYYEAPPQPWPHEEPSAYDGSYPATSGSPEVHPAPEQWAPQDGPSSLPAREEPRPAAGWPYGEPRVPAPAFAEPQSDGEAARRPRQGLPPLTLPPQVPRDAEDQTTRPRRRRKPQDNAAVAQMARSIPRRMRAHVAEAIEVRLDPSDVRALLDGLTGGMVRQRSGQAPALSVKLRAPRGGLAIDAISPETQWVDDPLPVRRGEITGAGGANWHWTVTPLKRGRRALQLIVSARTIGPTGAASEQSLPEQTVDIRVATHWGRALLRLFTWTGLAMAGAGAATIAGPALQPVLESAQKMLAPLFK